MGMVDKDKFYDDLLNRPKRIATEQSRQMIAILSRQMRSCTGDCNKKVGEVDREEWFDASGQLLCTIHRVTLRVSGNSRSTRIISLVTPDGVERIETRLATQDDWDKIAEGRHKARMRR